MSLFDRLFRGRGSPPPAPPSPSAAAGKSRGGRDSGAAERFAPDAYYPARDPGLARVDSNDLIGAHQQWLDRLRMLVPEDAAHFDEWYREPIRRLGAEVQTLPATPAAEFAGSAGLFAASLSLAFFARQSAAGKIFTPREDAQGRHADEPRWRYAAYCAGLLCRVPRTLAVCAVTTEDGTEWPRFQESLCEWLSRRDARRFFVRWTTASAGGGAGAEASMLLGRVIPSERLDWLRRGDGSIMRELTAVVAGSDPGPASILGKCIHTVVERVLQVENSTARRRYGTPGVGSHVEPYILDAFRHAVDTGRWRVNAGGPLWYGTDGLYLEWPAAATEVQSHFQRIGVPGMPASPFTLAEMLGRAHALVGTEGGGWTRDVLIADPRDPESTVTRSAIRFADARAILGYHEASPASHPYGLELAQAARLAVQFAPAPAPAPKARVESQPVGQGLGDPAPGLVDIADRPNADMHESPTVMMRTAPADRPAAPPAQIVAPTPAPPRAPAPATGGGAADLANKAERGAAHVRGVTRPRGPSAPPQAVEADSGEIRFARLVTAEHRSAFQADVCEAIGQAIAMFQQGRTDAVVESDRGVGIKCSWLSSITPARITDVVSRLERKGWLAPAPPDGLRGARAHNVQFGDTRELAVVITREGARALGFPLRMVD